MMIGSRRIYMDVGCTFSRPSATRGHGFWSRSEREPLNIGPVARVDRDQISEFLDARRRELVEQRSKALTM